MRNYKIEAFASAVLFLLATSHAQSLGDVARQQRQKQQAKGPESCATRSLPTKRSRSRPTLPPTPRTTLLERPSLPYAYLKHGKEDRGTMEVGDRGEKGTNCGACKARWKSSMTQSTSSKPTAITNGVQYNQYQLKKQQEAQRLQKQLDSEKKAVGRCTGIRAQSRFRKRSLRSRELMGPFDHSPVRNLNCAASAAPHSIFPAAPAENRQKACGP